MNLWILITATTATNTVVAEIFTSREAMLTHVWLVTGDLTDATIDKLEAGQFVPTKDGWLVMNEKSVVADTPTLERSADRNRDDAVRGLVQLGFKKPTAVACVQRAEAEVGTKDLDELMTESLRQAA